MDRNPARMDLNRFDSFDTPSNHTVKRMESMVIGVGSRRARLPVTAIPLTHLGVIVDVDQDGNKWLCTPDHGVIRIEEHLDKPEFKIGTLIKLDVLQHINDNGREEFIRMQMLLREAVGGVEVAFCGYAVELVKEGDHYIFDHTLIGRVVFPGQLPFTNYSFKVACIYYPNMPFRHAYFLAVAYCESSDNPMILFELAADADPLQLLPRFVQVRRPGSSTASICETGSDSLPPTTADLTSRGPADSEPPHSAHSIDEESRPSGYDSDTTSIISSECSSIGSCPDQMELTSWDQVEVDPTVHEEVVVEVVKGAHEVVYVLDLTAVVLYTRAQSSWIFTSRGTFTLPVRLPIGAWLLVILNQTEQTVVHAKAIAPPMHCRKMVDHRNRKRLVIFGQVRQVQPDLYQNAFVGPAHPRPASSPPFWAEFYIDVNENRLKLLKAHPTALGPTLDPRRSTYGRHDFGDLSVNGAHVKHKTEQLLPAPKRYDAYKACVLRHAH